MAGRLNFAFVIFPDNDEDMRHAFTSWAGWRHGEVIVNSGDVRRNSILGAQTTIAKALSANKGSQVGDVWIYTHGVLSGAFYVRREDNEGPVQMTPDLSGKYVKRYPALQEKLWRASDQDSRLHIYGCNMGLKPEAMPTARLIFMNEKSRACGPAEYFNLLEVSPSRLSGPAFTGGKCSPAEVPRIEIPTTFAGRPPASREELAAVEAEILKKLDGLKCLPDAQRPKAKALVSKTIWGHYERFLVERYTEMDAGWQVPPSLRRKAPQSDRRTIVDGMWNLWDRMGSLLYPFLSDTLLAKGAYPTSVRGIVEEQLARGEKEHFTGPSEPRWASLWRSIPSGSTGDEC